MLYDIHTHIGADPGFMLRGWWPYASTAQDLLERMHANGIDRAVCFPFTLPSAFDTLAFADRGRVELLPGRVPFDRENPLLAAELERVDLGGRLRMLAMFDPSREAEAQRRGLEALRRSSSRFVGLKVQATVLASPVAALLDAGRPIMEFAEAHALPVLMHTSIWATDAWSQVRDCLRVAEAFPRARFNLAHSLRFHAPSLREAAARPNVWVDCAAHLAHCQLAREGHPAIAARGGGGRVEADYARPGDVLAAVQDLLGGPDQARYLWGSDNPYMSWYDDGMRLMHTYAEEAAVLHALPAPIKHAMATAGPTAWLGEEEKRFTTEDTESTERRAGRQGESDTS